MNDAVQPFGLGAEAPMMPVHCPKDLQSNSRRWPSLINHVFFHITSMTQSSVAWHWHVALGSTMASVVLWRLCDILGSVLLGNVGS